MEKKRLMRILVLLMFIFSNLALAEITNQDNGTCTGFWNKIKCIFFGTSKQETALVGKAGGIWGGGKQ